VFASVCEREMYISSSFSSPILPSFQRSQGGSGEGLDNKTKSKKQSKEKPGKGIGACERADMNRWMQSEASLWQTYSSRLAWAEI